MAAEAAAAAQRRTERRRRLFIIGVAGLVVAAAVVVAIGSMSGGGGQTTVAASSSTTRAPSSSTTSNAATPTTTATAAASAGGKPCVAVSDPLPKGAPVVPVKVGPPPAQLVVQDLKVGTGATANPGATVTVNYIGVACSTGKIFDSSYTANQPATFPLSGVIKGWQDGIPGMKVGGQRLLGIPPAQAYGSRGQAPIGPDETLWFVVELVGVAGA
jgi:peptidylprolyl isomerase